MRRMFSEKQIEGFVKNTKKDISTLVDSNGNPRFIEGDGETATIEDITFSYAKWSLSGSHLMVVLAGEALNASVLTGTLASFTIPEWVFNKLVAITGNYLERKAFTLWGSDLSTQNQTISFAKATGNKITISCGSLTLTADRTFRFNTDLLIDND